MMRHRDVDRIHGGVGQQIVDAVGPGNAVLLAQILSKRDLRVHDHDVLSVPRAGNGGRRSHRDLAAADHPNSEPIHQDSSGKVRTLTSRFWRRRVILSRTVEMTAYPMSGGDHLHTRHRLAADV